MYSSTVSCLRVSLVNLKPRVGRTGDYRNRANDSVRITINVLRKINIAVNGCQQIIPSFRPRDRLFQRVDDAAHLRISELGVDRQG